jgi:hypothetical protein
MVLAQLAAGLRKLLDEGYDRPGPGTRDYPAGRPRSTGSPNGVRTRVSTLRGQSGMSCSFPVGPVSSVRAGQHAARERSGQLRTG